MKRMGTKAEEGPKVGWAAWRAKHDRKIQQPRRNKGAQQLAAPKKQESTSDH